jgi:hypothetical protein
MNAYYLNLKERKMELSKNTEVLVTVPFSYTIGEEGPVTGKVLKTLQDCKDEVVAELDSDNYPMQQLNMDASAIRMPNPPIKRKKDE